MYLVKLTTSLHLPDFNQPHDKKGKKTPEAESAKLYSRLLPSKSNLFNLMILVDHPSIKKYISIVENCYELMRNELGSFHNLKITIVVSDYKTVFNCL